MNPKAAVAVLLLIPVFAAAAEPSALEKALTKARQSYLVQKQGEPTLDASFKAEPPTDQAKRQEFATILAAVEAAKDVQLGCKAPCSTPADIQVYSGKVELTARRLGMKEPEVQAALKHYIVEGKPRLRGAAGTETPGGKAMEAEVIARMLSDGKLSPQLRTGLNQKALAIANSLGRTELLTADADGIVTMPDGRRARMSAAQLAELNQIPQAQAQILRSLATKPPPALTAQQKQDAALAEAEQAIKDNPGTVGDAYNYWKHEAEDPNSGRIWRAYAKTNMGLLTFSGLKAVEESSARLGYVWDNPDVSKGEKFWLGTKLAGNVALTAVSFLPAASFAKSIQAGEGFYWIGKAGAVVPGAVRAAAPEAAEASRALTTVIAETVPQGAKVGTTELRALIGGLNEKAARYGVTIVEGGTTGESVARGGEVLVSLKVGAQHETVHVVQQVYSRVMAVEQMAKESGVAVEALTTAQRAEAFANAAKWEAASYAQLESQAFRATGFMGMGGGAKYGKQLLLTGEEVSAGMSKGQVIDGSFSLGQRFYGRLTQALGHSQAEIGQGMRAASAGALQHDVFDPAKQLIDQTAQPYFKADVLPTAQPVPAAESAAAALNAVPGGSMFTPALYRYVGRPLTPAVR